MTRRVPVLPTLVVAAAVAAMIALGFWQIARAHWKEGLLARYATAQTLPAIAFPAVPTDETLLFRRAQGSCLAVTGWRASAGRNRAEEPGWRHVAACRTGAEGPGMQVDIGWSKDPAAPASWRGGPISGVIGPDSAHHILLVSDRAAPGLAPSALPSIDEIPNNHRSYAVQWFLFAGIALVIYVVALARRAKEPPPS